VTGRSHHDIRGEAGRAIRELRHIRHISQERLAAMAAVDRSYTGGIERGERRTTLEKIDQLLTAMGASWIEFAAELTRQRQVGKPLGDAAGRSGGARAASRRSSRRAG
jgi:transcriptional regulator with XRE-family HTH domain